MSKYIPARMSTAKIKEWRDNLDSEKVTIIAGLEGTIIGLLDEILYLREDREKINKEFEAFGLKINALPVCPCCESGPFGVP